MGQAAPGGAASPSPKKAIPNQDLRSASQNKQIPTLDMRVAHNREQRKAKRDADAAKAQAPTPQPTPTPAPVVRQAGWSPTPLQNMLLGLGLIALNWVTQSDLATLLGKLWTAPKSVQEAAKTVPFAPGSIFSLIGELIFVIVLAFLSGFSPTMARMIFFFWLGLYLVWLVFNGQKLSLVGAALQAFTPPQSTSAQLNAVGQGKKTT